MVGLIIWFKEKYIFTAVARERIGVGSEVSIYSQLIWSSSVRARIYAVSDDMEEVE